MENFTPYSALAGGAFIGLSATLLLWLNGRIAGISGILSGTMRGPADDRVWRALFLVGLIAGAAACYVLLPRPFELRQGFPPGLLALAGFLVGFGTTMGSGCTSGHGVCGMARMSRRSLTATLTFLATGMATVFVVRHLVGVGA